MLPALHCHKTVAMKTPMSVSDTGHSLHWELGQFYMCPTESAYRPCSIGSGTEMKHRNLRCISVRVGTGCIGTGFILVPVLGTQPYCSDKKTRLSTRLLLIKTERGFGCSLYLKHTIENIFEHALHA